MAKKIEMYEGRPVFQASDSKQLKKAVAKYKGEVPPPYVVRVPDETVSVCSRAFSANKDIGVVILPDSVWSIGDEAFCSCKNLTSIILPESPELTIGYWAFAGCSSLSDISIPSSVRRIKRHAFEYCNNLTKITIPASVWEIGAEAFGSCERLAEVTFLCLVEDVEEIDKDCLFECSNLNKIIVPYKQGIAYKKILPEELHALIVEQSRPATSDTKEDWEEGEEEDMANEIEMYEGRPVFRASDSRQLKRAVAQYEGDVRPPYVVRVPDKTKYLQPRTFWENKDIGVVILPDSVWSIDHGVFLDCKKLTSIILPKSLELIDEVAFSGCSSLSDISIPSSVCMIGDGAFESCNKLTKITIPASVFRIEHGAFWYCRRLTEVTFLGLVDKLAENCFKACPNLTKIIVPYKQGIAYKKMLPEELHALIVEQSGSATSDIKEDRDEGEEEDMASEIEITTVPLKRTNRSLK